VVFSMAASGDTVTEKRAMSEQRGGQAGHGPLARDDAGRTGLQEAAGQAHHLVYQIQPGELAFAGREHR
jgi:hypothetical protein